MPAMRGACAPCAGATFSLPAASSRARRKTSLPASASLCVPWRSRIDVGHGIAIRILPIILAYILAFIAASIVLTIGTLTPEWGHTRARAAPRRRSASRSWELPFNSLSPSRLPRLIDIFCRNHISFYVMQIAGLSTRACTLAEKVFGLVVYLFVRCPIQGEREAGGGQHC